MRQSNQPYIYQYRCNLIAPEGCRAGVILGMIPAAAPGKRIDLLEGERFDFGRAPLPRLDTASTFALRFDLVSEKHLALPELPGPVR
jgi:hypothetical protein